MDFNYYELLGIGKDATDKEIKKAYSETVKQYHPDVNKAPGATALARFCNVARETLLDPTKRKEYDRSLEAGSTSQRQRKESDKATEDIVFPPQMEMTMEQFEKTHVLAFNNVDFNVRKMLIEETDDVILWLMTEDDTLAAQYQVLPNPNAPGVVLYLRRNESKQNNDSPDQRQKKSKKEEKRDDHKRDSNWNTSQQSSPNEKMTLADFILYHVKDERGWRDHENGSVKNIDEHITLYFNRSENSFIFEDTEDNIKIKLLPDGEIIDMNEAEKQIEEENKEQKDAFSFKIVETNREREYWAYKIKAKERLPFRILLVPLMPIIFIIRVFALIFGRIHAIFGTILFALALAIFSVSGVVLLLHWLEVNIIFLRMLDNNTLNAFFTLLWVCPIVAALTFKATTVGVWISTNGEKLLYGCANFIRYGLWIPVKPEYVRKYINERLEE